MNAWTVRDRSVTGPGYGFFDHVVLAMTAEKVVLGVVDAKILGRDPENMQKSAKEKRQARRGKAIEDKESGRWLDGYRQACRVAQEAPETLVVCVSDSEGDVYECFLEGQPAADERKAAWIVRACQNRQVAAAEDRVHGTYVAGQAEGTGGGHSGVAHDDGGGQSAPAKGEGQAEAEATPAPPQGGADGPRRSGAARRRPSVRGRS